MGKTVWIVSASILIPTVISPSGIQVLPAIQPVVKTLTAFIRSPAWVLPTIGTAQRVYSREEIEVFAEDPEKLTAHRKANETMMNSIFSK